MSDVFRLRKVFDRIYMLTFPHQYDVNMHFVRYQEFYESPNEQFRGKPFRLLDFMRWWSVDRPDADGQFSYVHEWSGFNLPSWVLKKLFIDLNIPDENEYDITMRAVYETIRQREGNNVFYLIGCVERGAAIEHELAHGLWYVLPQFQKEMVDNITTLQKEHPKAAEAIRAALIKEGYDSAVVDDETQAYLATGLGGSLSAFLAHEGYQGRKLSKLQKPFIDTFKQYMRQADLPWCVDRN